MANRLTMAKIQAILQLHQQSWPARRIARELDVDRETVAKYVRATSCAAKPAKAPIGSDGASGSAAEAPEGGASDVQSGGQQGIEPGQPPPLADVPPGNSKPAKAPIGSDASKPAKAPIGSEGSKPADHGLRGGVAPIGSEAAFGAADPVPSSPDVVADVETTTTASALETEGSRSAC